MAQQRTIESSSIIFKTFQQSQGYSNTVYIPTPPGVMVTIIDSPETAGKYNCETYYEGYAYVTAAQEWWNTYFIYINDFGELILIGKSSFEVGKYAVNNTTGELVYIII